MIKLRPYQAQMIEDLEELQLLGKKRVLMVAPTGAGKTVIIAEIVKRESARGLRSLILVHRDTLIGQTVNKLQALGIEPGVIKAGHEEDRSRPVQVASLQTLANRLTPEADSVFFDEAHTTTFFSTSKQLLERFIEAKITGFTATPWRLKKGESLGEIFQGMVKSPGYRHLILSGHLACPRYFTYPAETRLDFSSVKKSGVDWNVKALDVLCNTDLMIGRLVDEYLRVCPDRKAICFAVSVAHAEAIASKLKTAGVAAGIITAKTKFDDRMDLIEKLSSGLIKVLVNVEVLTEGFDSPNVDCVILARPTLSKSLNFQMVGRGLRPAKGKNDCIILDFADNAFRHGLISDVNDWDFENLELAETGNAPVKSCPSCGAIIHVGLFTCPECGHVFDVKSQYAQPAADLEEIDRSVLNKTFLEVASLLEDQHFKEVFVKHIEIDAILPGKVILKSSAAKAFQSFVRSLVRKNSALLAECFEHVTGVPRYVSLTNGEKFVLPKVVEGKKEESVIVIDDASFLNHLWGQVQSLALACTAKDSDFYDPRLSRLTNIDARLSLITNTKTELRAVVEVFSSFSERQSIFQEISEFAPFLEKAIKNLLGFKNRNTVVQFAVGIKEVA